MNNQKKPEECVKWVTHYSSDHQILLVGDGDFSFSLCLANAFASATNIVATSLNSYDDVTRMYKQAKSNLDQLQKLGACLLHGVDATKMKLHSDLKMRRFDRVIFNFPHAGFHRKEDNSLMIKMHRELVFGFFKNASCMLRANGEVHVNHKTTTPFNTWNIEKLAMQNFLTLIECSDFKKEDYPGYNNKRGDSYRCDEPFPLGMCSTFKFIYNPKARLAFQEIQDAVEQLPTPIGLHYYPQASHIQRMNEHTPISRDYLNQGFNRISPSAAYHGHGINLGAQRSLQPMESLQSLQPWPASTNVRYSPTEHVGTMNTVPLTSSYLLCMALLAVLKHFGYVQ
ncbi:heavy metal-associated isoprenylated plant protein 41-like [Lotus japonicus]|uniref:heavy metal-associated isoprenylated plant protein 41-like n=1 Tax=Lotus japonicus TaxID=34305 RepID=UPI00258A0E76|nr:heavy metal-associated isoprenylated plant protein 41-like [Lotus japonicus]